jgi:hypothetical protein
MKVVGFIGKIWARGQMAYNVYLFNGLGIQPSGGINSTFLTGAQLASINQTLQGYFQRVVSVHDSLPGRTPVAPAAVQWLAAFRSIMPTELLIYLLPFGTTIVKNRKLEMGQPPPGHDGFTQMFGGTTGRRSTFIRPIKRY